jgi:hypothetical protein
VILCAGGDIRVAEFYTELNDELIAFIREQKVFFTATAQR